MKWLATLSLITVVMITENVWSWGAIGHRTIGEVAQELLPDSSKSRIIEIIGRDIADASNWADQIKDNPQWNYARWYHFERMPDDKSYLQTIEDMSAAERKQGGTVMALLEAEKVFLAANSSQELKATALKFIIHLVGDIHQPLHTGRNEDNGGNKIPINWNGAKTNLHAVWDYYIISEAHGEMFGNAPTGREEEVYAPYLLDKFSDYEAPKQSYEDINLWLNESVSYRDGAYEFKGEDESKYTKRFIPLVDSRLYLAGLRLAYVLNRLVKKENPPSYKQSFKQQIEKIVGSLSNIIRFEPAQQVGGSIPALRASQQ